MVKGLVLYDYDGMRFMYQVISQKRRFPDCRIWDICVY